MILFTLSNGDQGMVSDEDADLVAHTPWFLARDGYISHTIYPNGAHGKRKIQTLHRLVAQRMVSQALSSEDTVRPRDGNIRNCTRDNLFIRPRKGWGKKQASREMWKQVRALEEQGYLSCTQVAPLVGMKRTALLSQREKGRVSSVYLHNTHYMKPEITKAELLAYCATRPRVSGRKPCKALMGEKRENTSSSS